MKKSILWLLSLTTLIIILHACQEDQLPSNKTLVSPVGSLVVTLNYYDYTAVPQLLPSGQISDTLILKVDEPGTLAKVKSVSMSNANSSVVLDADSGLFFVNNVASLVVNVKGALPVSYYIKQVPRFIPVMYIVKTSDEDALGSKYYLKESVAPKLASYDNDNNYEGYADLTSASWDNLGVVNSNLKTYYDVNNGLSAVSSGTFDLTTEQSADGKFFSSAGPWANWNYSNANPLIVSPGYWKVNFDTVSKKLTLLETQWAIQGSAATSTIPEAMTYDSNSQLWSITATLSSGTLNFSTIPVTAGDPVVTYGELSPQHPTYRLSTSGSPFKVSEPGSYTITLNLGNAPYYTYSITKN